MEVALTEVEGMKIHYTIDGSVPDTKSAIYTKPVSINSTTVLRFAFFAEGLVPSPIQTETFFINETTALPIFSIATDSSWLFDPDTGLYMPGPDASEEYPYFGANFWGEKEIPAHFEFFESDRQEKLSIDAGISIAGNWSRADPKKSLAINFRESYGSFEIELSILFSGA